MLEPFYSERWRKGHSYHICSIQLFSVPTAGRPQEPEKRKSKRKGFPVVAGIASHRWEDQAVTSCLWQANQVFSPQGRLMGENTRLQL